MYTHIHACKHTQASQSRVQQLLEENARLQHELTDTKRRVLQAAKRKIAEHAGAIKVLVVVYM